MPRHGFTSGRPALKQCLGFLREGDTLLVTKIDRLARSRYAHVLDEEVAAALEQVQKSRRVPRKAG